MWLCCVHLNWAQSLARILKLDIWGITNNIDDQFEAAGLGDINTLLQCTVAETQSRYLKLFWIKIYIPTLLPTGRVEKKIGKICKISGETLVFSPQNSYIVLRWNAVNAVKLCKFTTRVGGDLTKIHHNSPLKYVNSPLNFTMIGRCAMRHMTTKTGGRWLWQERA